MMVKISGDEIDRGEKIMMIEDGKEDEREEEKRD